jgi:hypothetical protein
MIGDSQSRASEPIVYLDFSEIRDGDLEALKERIQRLISALEPHEPQLVTYGFYLNERAREMTVTAVHPDSASLELHMEIGRDEFRKVGELIALKQIHVYGRISDRAREMLEQKAKMLGGAGLVVSERFAGFDHLPAARNLGSDL